MCQNYISRHIDQFHRLCVILCVVYVSSSHMTCSRTEVRTFFSFGTRVSLYGQTREKSRELHHTTHTINQTQNINIIFSKSLIFIQTSVNTGL